MLLLNSLTSLSMIISLITISLLTHPSSSATESFLYGGCSQVRYTPGTPYESNVNSILNSLVNSAASAIFNNFKVSVPGSGPNDVVYGVFQCRGDLRNSDCRDCVSRAVSQLGTLCVTSAGGALQLDGCFVKYDNISFLGTEDKGVVMKRCGPSTGYDSDTLTRRDAVMDSIAAQGQFFRVGGSGDIHGVAQCVQDLSTSECQDCLSDAIGRLKSECASATWGDMFLGTCYARFSERGSYTKTESDDETDKTLAILIGLIAGVALLILFLSVLSRAVGKRDGK